METLQENYTYTSSGIKVREFPPLIARIKSGEIFSNFTKFRYKYLNNVEKKMKLKLKNHLITIIFSLLF